MRTLKAYIQKHFPQVEEVIDAKKNIAVEVRKEDTKQGRRKDPEGCALARACVRSKEADGAIIGIGYSYLVKGKVATRYKTSTLAAREITSFDRHHDFDFGKKYLLSAPCPSSKLGVRKKFSKTRGPHTTKKVDTGIVHKAGRTARIRVMQ
jgi:hypothetical protein